MGFPTSVITPTTATNNSCTRKKKKRARGKPPVTVIRSTESYSGFFSIETIFQSFDFQFQSHIHFQHLTMSSTTPPAPPRPTHPVCGSYTSRSTACCARLLRFEPPTTVSCSEGSSVCPSCFLLCAGSPFLQALAAVPEQLLPFRPSRTPGFFLALVFPLVATVETEATSSTRLSHRCLFYHEGRRSP